jgi:hypothetical protein
MVADDRNISMPICYSLGCFSVMHVLSINDIDTWRFFRQEWQINPTYRADEVD